MPHPDQLRWDTRYSQEKRFDNLRPRKFLVEFAELLPRTGLALDAAMGLGKNAEFLILRGLRVIGVEISEVALFSAKQALPRLMAVQADMGQFWLPDSMFDVIINFYFLERSLYSVYTRALKPGGILIFQTLTQEMRQVHPEIEPNYLLEQGELVHAFPYLETLVYREGWIKENEHTRPVASLIARKSL